MTVRIATLALLLGGAVVPLGAPVAGAAQSILERHFLRGGSPPIRPAEPGRVAHFVYGTIVSVRGASLILRTRRGNELAVNASAAIAAGTYSAPLFAGKLVVIGWSSAYGGVIQALNITRMTKLDLTTGPDR